MPVKRYQRSYYYVCEPGKGDGMLQTRLSLKKTASSKKMTPDNIEPENAIQNFVGTSKAGQHEINTELERA